MAFLSAVTTFKLLLIIHRKETEIFQNELKQKRKFTKIIDMTLHITNSFPFSMAPTFPLMGNCVEIIKYNSLIQYFWCLALNSKLISQLNWNLYYGKNVLFMLALDVFWAIKARTQKTTLIAFNSLSRAFWRGDNLSALDRYGERERKLRVKIINMLLNANNKVERMKMKQSAGVNLFKWVIINRL